MKRIGPELKKPDLKMPDLKVPPMIRDLYRDLHDRRLLPLVGLLLVGIIAAPFLLSNSDSTPRTLPAPVGQSPAAGASVSHTRLTVVKAAPGLREPSKRLSHLHAKDPFKQQYTNAPTTAESSPVTSTSVSSESATAEVVSEETAETPSSGSPGETGGSAPGSTGNPGDHGGLVLYTFAADIKIVRTETKKDGSKETGDPVERDRVLPPTVLPSEKAQVVTYMGISPKTRKPLFLVSPDVTAVFGEGKCVSGTGSCQLIELDPKFPETFVYGENDVRYKVTVLSVEPVATGHS
jgi:hypothetical protein